MQAFKVGNLRLIAGFNQGFESGLDKGCDAAAENGLFTEEIGFGFFLEGGFNNTSAGAPDTFGVSANAFTAKLTWSLPPISLFARFSPVRVNTPAMSKE
jgi:hypothetical protein